MRSSGMDGNSTSSTPTSPLATPQKPFLQALAEAYRQMAMLAPTITIGDMNAAPTQADRGGQATLQHHASATPSKCWGSWT